MAKYIVEIPDEIEISKDSQLVPFDMCRPSWWEEAYNKGKADAKRKTGKWIEVDFKDGYMYGWHKCSVCEAKYTLTFDTPPDYKFCPNCGADMRGEDNA